MGSAVSNGTTSVGTRTHEAGMNLSTFTWAGWVKRTGAGESDFRLYNKANGTAIGSPNITGQGGAVTRLRGRHSAGGGGGFDLAITNDGALPLNTWVCLFATWGAAGTPALKIYMYDGSTAVTELTYSSQSTSGAALSFNTDPLTVFNTTDGSQCYAGKAAHWVMTPDVWTTTDMLSFAQGTLPTGLYEHYWPFQSDGGDDGETGGWDFTLSNVTFDGADSPPVTYGGGTPATATPAVIAASTALPAATVSTTTAGTATPATIATTTALPAATATGTAGATVTPATIAVTAALTDWAVDVTASPDPVAAAAALPAATVSAGGSATVTPVTITAVAALPPSTVSAAVTVAPDVLAAVAAVPSVTVLAEISATVSPSTLELTVAMPPVASAGGPATEVAIHTGAVSGPARLIETATGPGLTHDVTGPALRRQTTGPDLVRVDVAGPAPSADPVPDGPSTARDVTGPETARTVTGPGV